MILSCLPLVLFLVKRPTFRLIAHRMLSFKVFSPFHSDLYKTLYIVTFWNSYFLNGFSYICIRCERCELDHALFFFRSFLSILLLSHFCKICCALVWFLPQFAFFEPYHFITCSLWKGWRLCAVRWIGQLIILEEVRWMTFLKMLTSLYQF